VQVCKWRVSSPTAHPRRAHGLVHLDAVAGPGGLGPGTGRCPAGGRKRLGRAWRGPPATPGWRRLGAAGRVPEDDCAPVVAGRRRARIRLGDGRGPTSEREPASRAGRQNSFAGPAGDQGPRRGTHGEGAGRFSPQSGGRRRHGRSSSLTSLKPVDVRPRARATAPLPLGKRCPPTGCWALALPTRARLASPVRGSRAAALLLRPWPASAPARPKRRCSNAPARALHAGSRWAIRPGGPRLQPQRGGSPTSSSMDAAGRRRDRARTAAAGSWSLILLARVHGPAGQGSAPVRASPRTTVPPPAEHPSFPDGDRPQVVDLETVVEHLGGHGRAASSRSPVPARETESTPPSRGPVAHIVLAERA